MLKLFINDSKKLKYHEVKLMRCENMICRIKGLMSANEKFKYRIFYTILIYGREACYCTEHTEISETEHTEIPETEHREISDTEHTEIPETCTEHTGILESCTEHK